MLHVRLVYLITLQVTTVLNAIVDMSRIEIVDLTRPMTWNDMSRYYGTLEKKWSMCYKCGAHGLGTALHLESPGVTGSVHPAVIPAEYLLTRLQIVDVATLVAIDPTIVLTPEIALQWSPLKRDPFEPTLLLFRFGWKEEHNKKIDTRTCSCKMPGLSYELAEWIVANLSHVVGVGTDTPSLESEQTREFTTRTVSNILGRSGVYMIENVNLKKKIPEVGCLTITMPLKMLSTSYVPARLTAFCPPGTQSLHVVMTVRPNTFVPKMLNRRVYDINLDELLS